MVKLNDTLLKSITHVAAMLVFAVALNNMDFSETNIFIMFWGKKTHLLVRISLNPSFRWRSTG